MNYKMIAINNHKSKGAMLSAHQKDTNCPFEIKRVFYIYDIEQGCHRGAHANINSQFMFIMLKGSCKIKIDNGKNSKTIMLQEGKEALYIDKMIWKEMFDFSTDSILLVLSDKYYDESEYIHNYDQYKSHLL